MFIWVAFINDIAVSMQKSAVGGDLTKISTKLITLTAHICVALEANILDLRPHSSRSHGLQLNQVQIMSGLEPEIICLN